MTQVATPAFTPDGGAIAPEGTFTLSTATGGATIYYTYTNDAPDPLTWTEYTGAVTLPAEPSSSIQVRAYALKSGDDDSDVETVIFQTQVSTPEFSPAGGQVGPGDTFTISCDTAGATIYYTFGNSTPNAGWTQYTGAVTLPELSGQTINVRAYAVKSGGIVDSDVGTTSFYTIGYSSAVSADAPAVLDATSSQGLGAVCEGIGLIGSDGESLTDASRIGGAAADLVFETN